MRVSIRLLWVLLIALALPVQGVAAATMAFCGLAHHGGGAAGDALGIAAPEPLQHSATGHHCEADTPAAAPVADDAPSVSKPSQAAQHKCSACATCGTLGALLAAVPVVPTAAAAPTVFTTVVPTIDAFAVGGPDRPPRNLCV